MTRGPKNVVFFAYASHPPLRVDTMKHAIEELDSEEVNAFGWESLSIAGKRLIDPILAKIDESTHVVAELSNMNSNVLFEFGYAIACGKDAYIALDDSDQSAAALWKTFPMFEQVGRIDYSGDHHRLVGGVYGALSGEGQSLSQSLIAGARPREDNSIFAVHSPVKHTAANSLEKFLERQTHLNFLGSNADLIVAPLEFYTKEIYRSSAAIFHLLGTNRKKAQEHNAMASFLAGFARGLKLPIVMAVESGFDAPLDYANLIFEYSTAAQLQSKIETWLQVLPKSSDSKRRLGRLDLDIELPIDSFGEYVAEYESDNLPNYFIQTSEFNKVLGGEARIFAGRKGTGKSATMSQAAAELSRDRAVLVVPIKPSSHEMSGLTRIVSDYGKGGQLEYLLTMIWKYVVETEVALRVLEVEKSTLRSPADQKPLAELSGLLSHMGIDASSSFSDRVERVASRLRDAAEEPSVELTAEAVAKGLRADGLPRLVELTRLALGPRTRISVLVDNLDKNWESGSHLESLSRLILSLLVASGAIEKDYERHQGSRSEVSCRVSLFVRTDILDAVKKYAREPDKIGSRTVDWDDEQLLVRVLEERYSANSKRPGDTMWLELFCGEVQGLPTRDYLLWRVLRRPRDFIYMANAALTTAINRKHERIDASDIVHAEKEYSRFAVEALLVESVSIEVDLEEALFEFAGVDATLDQDELEAVLQGGPQADDLKWWLMSTSFLGVETSDGEFEYVQGLDASRRKLKVAERKSTNSGRSLRFRVHPAFRKYLEIIDDDLHV